MAQVIAGVSAGADAVKSVEEAITGAFHAASDCLGDTLNMQAMTEKAAHDAAEKFTARESAVRRMMDTLVALVQDKFNIIIARDYGRDVCKINEANPSMGTFRVEYAKGEFDTFRIYLFNSGSKGQEGNSSYDRPMGPSWEKDGILWYPAFAAAKPVTAGCMYLTGFQPKPGMTEAERVAAGDQASQKQHDADEHEKDVHSQKVTDDAIQDQRRQSESVTALGTASPTPSDAGDGDDDAKPSDSSPASDAGDGGDDAEPSASSPAPSDAGDGADDAEPNASSPAPSDAGDGGDDADPSASSPAPSDAGDGGDDAKPSDASPASDAGDGDHDAEPSASSPAPSDAGDGGDDAEQSAPSRAPSDAGDGGDDAKEQDQDEDEGASDTQN